MMRPQLVKDQVNSIREAVAKRDFEKAHALEDRLYHQFVEFVAETYEGSISVLAKEVLKTQKIEFSRWCA